MLIEKPLHIPVAVPFLVDAVTNNKHHDAAIAVIEATGASGADGLNVVHHHEWGTTFVGPMPKVEAVVQVAEAHGYDVLHGPEALGDTEWGATFRSVGMRTHEAIAAYCHEVERQEHEAGDPDRPVLRLVTASPDGGSQ